MARTDMHTGLMKGREGKAGKGCAATCGDLDVLLEVADQLIVRELGARVAHNLDVGREEVVQVQGEKRRVDLLLGQIARRAEHDDGERLCSEVRVAVCVRVRVDRLLDPCHEL